MKSIELNISDAIGFVGEEKFKGYEAEAVKGISNLNNGEGAGNDFHGWVKLPEEVEKSGIIDEIQATADKLNSLVDYVVCVGIGGSYLGAKAVIEGLSNSFEAYRKTSKGATVLFAGQNLSEDYIAELQEFLKDKKFGIIVISKSGTTTEPAVAFRLLKDQLEAQVGKEAAKDIIVAVTDAKKGALRTLATQEGYKTFVIPDNVGGRFSVLTPVGLLPIAVAGKDIRSLVAGAAKMQEETHHAGGSNASETYAMLRNALYNDGKVIEVLVNYNPKLHFFGEWWKQLYGESEGKDGKGIFPASVDLTTDLHSMGQLLQQGKRNIFETVISVNQPDRQAVIPSDALNLDGLNFLAGQHVDHINKMAELGTKIAHVEGGVPVIRIEIDRLNEYYLGQLIYFFEKACGISGYILGVNPFNQPGVEAYKKNMFALLNKPGYEKESEAIKAKI